MFHAKKAGSKDKIADFSKIFREQTSQRTTSSAKNAHQSEQKLQSWCKTSTAWQYQHL